MDEDSTHNKEEEQGEITLEAGEAASSNRDVGKTDTREMLNAFENKGKDSLSNLIWSALHLFLLHEREPSHLSFLSIPCQF